MQPPRSSLSLAGAVLFVLALGSRASTGAVESLEIAQTAPRRSLQETPDGASSTIGRVGAFEMNLRRLSQAQGGVTLGGFGGAGGSSSCYCSTPWTPPLHDECGIANIGGRERDGYGAWPACLNHIPINAIVYSFGIGGDASFDAALIERGATVFGFDPTISPEKIPQLFVGRSPDVQSQFHFMQVGLGVQNGVTSFLRSTHKGIGSMTALSGDEAGASFKDDGFQAAVLTLPTLMAVHGHAHIDVLKIDIEGIEFYICESAPFLEALDRVGQVLFEFHGYARNADEKQRECIRLMESKGFRHSRATNTGEHVFSRLKPQAPIHFYKED